VVSAGVELLFAISAPTGLAIDTAQRWGVTLCGGVHVDTFSIHTHGHRVVLPKATP
jgi:FdhD protein